jgi:glycosyltransferase involved in cell wall biosynthesis
MESEPISRLSVIVLTRNEEKNIAKILEDVADEVQEPFEILVVDDSVDSTADIVREVSTAHPNIRLVTQEGKGYTSALTTAVKYADGDAMVVMVGDSSDDIRDIDKMRKKMVEGYDVVCASRYMRGGAKIGGSFLQSVFSYLVGKSLKILVGIPTCDISNSFKMYRRNIFEGIQIEDASFATSMQITLKAFFNGNRITEIPTVWRNRVEGSSKFLIKSQTKHYMYWYFWAILKSITVRMQRWRNSQ